MRRLLLREPANVTGDGEHTVSELIDLKNSHPYRGKNRRAPLEMIRSGEIEELMLREQGYTFRRIFWEKNGRRSICS
ncbi:MAG: hypothetical protein U5K84_00205 [Alkalibacterium sp.]|nr:hypothetical protein [Alkalibacterium sp.]